MDTSSTSSTFTSEFILILGIIGTITGLLSLFVSMYFNRKAIEQSLSIALLLSTFIYLFLISFTKINMLDEGFLLYSSLEIMNGKLPYKDFFYPYTPGFLYLHAFLFKMFGINILVGRIAQAFLGTITSLIIFKLSKRIMPTKFAILPSLIYLIWGIPQWNTPWVGWYALTFGFIAIYFVIIAIEKSNHNYLFYSGIFVALSILFKTNTGVFAFISIIIFLFLNSFLYNLPKQTLKMLIRPLLVYILGLSLIFIPFIIYINSHSLFNSFIDDIWYNQIQRYRFTMNIPFPSPIELIPNHFGVREISKSFDVWIFYTPILIYIIIAIFCIRKVFCKDLNKKISILLLFLLFGSLQFLQIYPRSDFPHLIFSLPPSFILGSYVIYIAWNKTPKLIKNPNPYKTSFFRLLIILLLMLYISLGLITVVKTLNIYLHDDYSLLEMDRAKILVPKEQKEEINEVVIYITSHTERDDKILVVPFDAMYYFLAERENPCRYNQFLKDFNNEQEVIQCLRESNVKYIIYRNSEWMNMTEIAPELDIYIKKQYSIIKSYENINIYHIDNYN